MVLTRRWYGTGGPGSCWLQTDTACAMAVPPRTTHTTSTRPPHFAHAPADWHVAPPAPPVLAQFSMRSQLSATLTWRVWCGVGDVVTVLELSKVRPLLWRMSGAGPAQRSGAPCRCRPARTLAQVTALCSPAACTSPPPARPNCQPAHPRTQRLQPRTASVLIFFLYTWLWKKVDAKRGVSSANFNFIGGNIAG